MEIPIVLQPILTLLAAAILVPVISFIGKALKSEKIREIFAVSGFIVAFYKVFILYEAVMSTPGHVIKYDLSGYGPPFGVVFTVDLLSVFMAFLFCGLGTMAAIFSVRYMEEDSGLDKYYALLCTMVAGMVGVVFAGDFFNFFVFWETMCISSYVLVAFRTGRWEPIEAGFKYLVMSTFGTLLVLYAMSLLYGLTGTLNFAYMAQAISSTSAASPVLYFILGLMIVGFGVSASIAPFHTWLPDAHPAAPSPISALLSGVVIKAGVYALCRISFLIFPLIHFHWGILIGIISVLTMTVGNILALWQNDVKRLLAYSSIAQIGYILVGVAAGTQLGLTGTIFHIFNHALMKGAAFLCAGAFIYRAETRMLHELSGIGRRMPISTITLSIALFGLIGMPPLNGFISKLILFTSAFLSPGMVWLAVAGVVNSAISAAYYLRFIVVLIRHEPAGKIAMFKEAPITMLAPICVMAAFIILFGIWPQPILDFAQEAAASLLRPEAYISAVRGGL